MGVDTENLPCEFGKYHLIERIATGGMAELYRAKLYGAGGFEKDLAIKKVLPQLANDKAFIQMFMDEAMITVTLNHGNIVSVLDFGELEDEYFLVMEYVDGVDLQSTIRRCSEERQPIPVPVACMIAEHICRGLDYAHRKVGADGNPLQIVHRDVSPQNILLSFEGEVKIVDFGIARAASRITSTQAGVVKGKVAYMSPEQLTGHEVDNRSDIFAAGIILYEMLTNRRPFAGQTPQETMAAITRNGFEKPQKYNKKIDKKLNPLLRKALEKNPKKRYQTAGEMANALSAFLHRTGLHPDPTELVSFISKRMPDVRPRTIQPTPVRLIRRQTEEEMRAAGQARAESDRPPPAPPVTEKPAGAASQNVPHAFPPAQAAPPRQQASGSDPSGQDEGAVIVDDGEAVSFDMLGLPRYEGGPAGRKPEAQSAASSETEPADSTRPTDPVRPATRNETAAANQPDIHRATTQPLPRSDQQAGDSRVQATGDNLLHAQTRLLDQAGSRPGEAPGRQPVDSGIYRAETRLLPREDDGKQEEDENALLSAATNLMLKQTGAAPDETGRQPPENSGAAAAVPQAAPQEPGSHPSNATEAPAPASGSSGPPVSGQVAASPQSPAAGVPSGNAEEVVEDAWMAGEDVPQGVAGTDSVKAAAFPSRGRGLKIAIGALAVAAVIVAGYLIVRPADSGRATDDQSARPEPGTADDQPAADTASTGLASAGGAEPDGPGAEPAQEQPESDGPTGESPGQATPQTEPDEPGETTPPGETPAGEGEPGTPAGEPAAGEEASGAKPDSTTPAGEPDALPDAREETKQPEARGDEPTPDEKPSAQQTAKDDRKNEKQPARKPGKRRTRRRKKRRHNVARADSTRRPAPARGTGKLRINAEPFAVVYLGKKRIGPTPQMNIELPAGSHTLTLRNEALGLTRRVRVRIEPDKVHTVFVDLNEK